MGDDELFARAQRAIPGGVNSPVRAYKGVGGTPRFITGGRGAVVTDRTGAELIDYVMSYGAIILGHGDERVAGAVAEAASRGTSLGAPTEAEVAFAEAIIDAVPSIERVRLVNSGTEATMSAVRLARGATGRDGVITFAGCYHGHSDGLLAEAGSGVASVPGTAGVTAGAARDTHIATYNDPASVDAILDHVEVAAVLVEPVAANMGVVPPAPGFLEHLRARCTERGTVLIFDEVITGFRVARGGAQSVVGVTPDLTCLGKVIGGGIPIGAFGGRADLMEHLAPAGGVYQAGTLSGNPVAVSAGLAVLDALTKEPPYERLASVATTLAEALVTAARSAGIAIQVNRFGGLLSVAFAEHAVTDLASARAADPVAFARLFHGLLAAGVHVAPGPMEAWFPSAAHTDEHVERTRAAIGDAMGAVAAG